MEAIGVENVLEASWRRCRAWGVDPVRVEPAVLEAAELRQRREEHQQLLAAVGPYVHRLYAWMKRIRATVIVAAPDGVILDSMGDPVFLREADKVHLKGGANWHERVKGTNAIGTAAQERRPVAVIGSDHYCAAHHFLWCVASPVWSPSGEMLGVLDVSGFSEEYHPAAFALVETCARHIEDWLLLCQAEAQLVLSLVPENGQTQALLAVDRDGVITGANLAANSLLAPEETPLTGRSVFHLLEGIQPLLGGQSTGREGVVFSRASAGNLHATVLVDNRPAAVPVRRSSKGSESAQAWSCRYAFTDIIGDDPVFQAAIQLARRAAGTDYNVLIFGETGTGKEMVAQAIHQASLRSDKPFVAINCGAIPRNVMEAELFGYEPGAFTGAKPAGQPGKLELADGGTLFLDEVADMPPDVQVAMLRVLQERAVLRVGGVKPQPVEVRIIAATHKDLWQEVQAGRFRTDLYYRLQGVTVELPPLRQRKDLRLLAERLLEWVARELGRPPIRLTASAWELLSRYPWPGNVRELLAVLRHAAFLAAGEEITPECLPAHVRHKRSGSTGVEPLRQAERERIDQALKQTGGNISQAARLLGIGRTTLYRKLAKWT